MVDFRQPTHVQQRLGWFHTKQFNAAFLDLSARRVKSVDSAWSTPLP